MKRPIHPLGSGLAMFAVGLCLTWFGSDKVRAASTLTEFQFDANGQIDETGTGWSGTAIGGSSLILGSNVSLTQNLKAFGAYQGGPGNDVFHVDNWQSMTLAENVTAGNKVSFIITPTSGYWLDLGGGTVETLLHYHYSGSNANQIFDKVSVYIGGNYIGDADFSHAANGGAGPFPAQTLAFNVPNAPQFNGLTGATEVAFYFWDSTATTGNPGSLDPGNDSGHGPEWDLGDNAYIKLTGTVAPEPSQTILCFLGCIGIFLRRRR